MKAFRDLIAKVSTLLSSPPSVFFFIFLFVYLVIFGLLGIFFPHLAPRDDLQAVFGNYASVLSAFGASLAASAGVLHAKHLKKLHQKHDNLQKSVEELHQKIDQLSK